MKEKCKTFLASLVYAFYEKKLLPCEIHVMSIDETLDELLRTQKSLVRFGDGEIIMIRGKSLYFQHSSPEIAQRLSDILRYQEDGLMVAIPDIFNGLAQYRESGRRFWKDHLLFFRGVYRTYCDPAKRYGNAYVSRCYYNFADQSASAGWFAKIRRLWQDREIVVAEGETTHNGVGNDLFDGAKKVRRILCPAENAGDFQTEILTACLEMPSDALFLLSLGPAAKLLAQDLFYAGRRVIDIGNLDMEYEWFLQGAKEKVKLQKHTVRGIEENERAGYTEYLRQIVRRVGI